jgi:dihydroneopterin aldolase/2-amino-4-hydroxy-6-hydroxymethyldihydropteridine diphosphokinase
MGNRRGQIAAAVQALKAKDRIRHLEVSDLIETEPYGYKEQENFLNGAIVFDTLYSPEELLVCLQQIEEAGHRERTVHWGPRTIDLDIIFYGDRVVDKEKLKIPHREMHLRKFVLEPLAQIAPWEVHPLFHKSVYEMLQDLESGDSTEKEGKSL